MPNEIETKLSTLTNSTPVEGAASQTASHHQSGANYRPDIDGLRAIAILPVLFYHAGFSLFGGGFVGVDVFFVVSGFLITSLILPEVLQGKFSITHFYERRIRRIFPALFTVMLVSLLASYWLMWPLAFKDFGQSLVAATVFASNFLFWFKFGYFDTPADSRPLLHTWSLAVEEQFYILFPIYLIVVARFFPRALKGVTAIIAILSFGWSLISVLFWPSAAFYLAPSRIWELLLGAMLAMKVFPPLNSHTLRNALAVAGLVMIALAVFLLTSHSPFPGAYALLPVVGTFLVIHAGTGQPNAVNRLLSMRWLVFIGLISYSLYLWHWPLIVFVELYRFRDVTTTEAWGIILLSLALAILSWKFIEQPFRTRRLATSRRSLFVAAGVVMALTIGLGLPLHFTGGLPQRMPPQAQHLASISGDCFRRTEHCDVLTPEEVHTDRLCRVGEAVSARPDFVLWGDSHGEFVLGAIAQAATATNRSGLQITSEGCPPLLGITRPDKTYRHCTAFSDAAAKVISDPQINQVILVARWSLWSEGSRYRYENGQGFVLNDDASSTNRSSNRDVFRRGMVRTLDALKAMGKKISVVAPIPEIGWDVPSTLALGSWHHRRIHSEPTLSEFQERNRFAFQLLQELQPTYNLDLIYPHQILCDQQICRAMIDNQPLYCDDDHLSNYGRSLLVPTFQQLLSR